MQADSLDPLSLQAKRALAAFLVAVLALLLFVGAEAFVRITRPHDDLWALTGRSVASHPIGDWYFLDAFSAYRARPGVRSDGSMVKTVDSAGFISTPEIASAKPPNTIQIRVPRRILDRRNRDPVAGHTDLAMAGGRVAAATPWPTQQDRVHQRRHRRVHHLRILWPVVESVAVLLTGHHCNLPRLERDVLFQFSRQARRVADPARRIVGLRERGSGDCLRATLVRLATSSVPES